MFPQLICFAVFLVIAWDPTDREIEITTLLRKRCNKFKHLEYQFVSISRNLELCWQVRVVSTIGLLIFGNSLTDFSDGSRCTINCSHFSSCLRNTQTTCYMPIHQLPDHIPSVVNLSGRLAPIPVANSESPCRLPSIQSKLKLPPKNNQMTWHWG